jgi:uncharacterized membrane protein
MAFIFYGVFNYARYVFSFIDFDQAILDIGILVVGVLFAILASLLHRHFSSLESENRPDVQPAGVPDDQTR